MITAHQFSFIAGWLSAMIGVVIVDIFNVLNEQKEVKQKWIKTQTKCH